MFFDGLVVVLTAVLFRVYGEQFNCKNGHSFCYWTRSTPSNWTTAYGDCTRSGGSLVYSQHSAYIEEWMSSMNISIPNGRVWSSLHRVNYRFQLLHDRPEFIPIAASEWVPGHPLVRQWPAKRDCVVVNHRMFYESVDCDSSFAIICAISIDRKVELNNLVLPRGDPQVKLVVDPTAFEQKIVTNHLEIDRSETNLMLKCKVAYNGTRKLKYSWIKDGVFLGNNQSALIPATVHDKSKTVSEDAIYQKQGTYQCQVKEFGAVEAFISNSIIITYRRVLNAVVSISISNLGKNVMNIDAIMGRVRDFIHQNVLRDNLKLNDFETAWDPLYSLPVSPNEIEYRHSLYVDIVRQYPDGTLFHIMDVVSENVNNNQQLIHLSGAEKISVKWTNYCPKHNETITVPNNTSSDIFHTFWPPSWVTPIVHPISENVLCIKDNNRAEPLARQCLPEFSRGASLTPLNKCNRLVGQPETRCRPGYQWLETKQVCFKVTENGSWSETMSVCMNEWPTHDMASVDYATHHSVITQYQETAEGQLQQDLWLPVRRSSIYGLLHYYSSVNYGPEGINLPSTIEHQASHFTDEDECMLLTKNSKREVVHCSTRTIPGVCVYRPRRSVVPVASINLCSPPWHGYTIQNGKLTCFSLFQSESPMNWQEADQMCRHQEHVGMVATMATFENTEKVHQWNTVSFLYPSGLKSAWIGLFWSESDRKFCWLNSSEKNCEFKHFNWHPSVNWTNGRYGILEETWNLLPISGTRHQVLCQTVMDLSVTQNIRVRHTPDDLVQVQLTQDTRHYFNPMPHSFANLSEFFSLGWRPWIFGIPPATEVGIQVNCFLDGEMIQRINLFPDEFSLRPNFSAAKIFHCEGWVGWPRRFVRSDPIIVLRPDKSFVYLMMLNVSDGHGLQVDNQNNSLDFRPDPLSDISKRLERLGVNGNTVQVTGHRWWNYNQTKRILVRAVITSRSANQQNWPELLKDAFLLPEENQPFYQLVYIRSADACEQETSTDVTQRTSNVSVSWKEVPIGFTSESSSPCETVDGFPILRKCLGNPNTGAVWEPFTDELLQPYNGSCRPATNLLTELRKLTDDVSTNNIDPSSALVRLSEIAETEFTGSTSSRPSGIEIGQAARLLHASVQRIEQPSMREFNDVSKTLTTMLTSTSQLEQAQFLPGVSNSLIESLEQVMGQVNIPEGQGSVVFHHPKMSTESILNPLHVVGYGANVAKNTLEIQNGARILQNDLEINLVEELVNRDIAIILPVDEIRIREGLRTDTSLRLSFSVFANADLFDARPVTSLFSNDDDSSYVVDSAIIVAQVGNSMISNLTQSVRIFFRSRSQHNQTVTPVCVFWDKSSVSGGWSALGCQYVGRNQDLYICECNHLTPLALLFPYFDKDKTVDYRHRIALSLISVVGCVASMVGLSMVILTFFLFKKWRKSLGNKILFNFSLALFCVTGCFLCAGLMTFDHRLCKATAASMHYFLLASFAWMVVEGIYQYLNYVVVIGAQNYKSCFMRRASPVAWGLPILAVLGIFIYDPDLYAIGDEFCWLKLEAFYYTVLTPISIMLLFNIFIFVGVLKNVLCLRMRSNLRTSQSVQTRSWYQFRMAVCIFFLLGLAWIFGFASIGDARLVFAYLFCIFNSLQGFAIFAFFVLRERNARKLWFEFTRMCGDQLLVSGSKTLPTSRSSDYVLKPISRY